MIDYNELEKYYTGVAIPVITNAGGIFLELGDDIKTLFYKLDEDHYVDVNNRGIAQILRQGSVITSNYVVPEDSLAQVKAKRKINNNSSLVKRLTFKPSKYNQK